MRELGDRAGQDAGNVNGRKRTITRESENGKEQDQAAKCNHTDPNRRRSHPESIHLQMLLNEEGMRGEGKKKGRVWLVWFSLSLQSKFRFLFPITIPIHHLSLSLDFFLSFFPFSLLPFFLLSLSFSHVRVRDQPRSSPIKKESSSYFF